MLLDDSGRVTRWEPAAQELFGWSADEAVGRPVATLIPDPDTDAGREQAESLASAQVAIRPVVAGAAVTWEVQARATVVGSRDAAVLGALFRQAPVGLHILDPDLRVVRMNIATRALRDVPAADVIGRKFTDAYRLDEPEVQEAVARRVLQTGEPAMDHLVRASLKVRHGRRRRAVYSASLFRLEGPRGEVLGLVASAVDVTEREATRGRLAVLDTVRERVGQRLDVVAVCQELVDAVVPAFASIVVVEVVDDVVRGEAPPLVPLAPDVPLRRAAFRGVTSAHPVGDVRQLPAGTPFSQVLFDLRPRLVPIEEHSPWLDADPARASAIRASEAHSLIVAPLAVRGEALGVVSFYRHGSADPFDEHDLRLALDICAHAALCVDNARRYTRERTIAATVQRRMLPQRPPSRTTALETVHIHLPGTEGAGAWFDVIALPGARTALVVGDVGGQGIEAATTMGQLRTVIHSLAALDVEPDELLARLSDTATRLAAERAELPMADPLRREPVTAGCIVAVYDPVELTCTIARAGSPEPVAVLPDGSVRTLSAPAGPLLAGGGDDAPYPATTVAVPADSTLAFCTAALAADLLVETGALRRTLERYGLRPLRELCDTVTYAVTDDSRRGNALMLLARTSDFPAGQVLDLDLPAGPEAGPAARQGARRQLAEWGLDEETAFTAELVVSELVGNAVRYGEPPLRLRLILDQSLTCEVRDTGASAPRVKHARTVDETGRGLFIIAHIADQWGTRYHPGGKTIWAVLELSPRRREARPSTLGFAVDD